MKVNIRTVYWITLIFIAFLFFDFTTELSFLAELIYVTGFLVVFYLIKKIFLKSVRVGFDAIDRWCKWAGTKRKDDVKINISYIPSLFIVGFCNVVYEFFFIIGCMLGILFILSYSGLEKIMKIILKIIGIDFGKQKANQQS